MPKIIILDDLIVVTLSSGESVQKTNATTEDINVISNAKSEEEILDIMCPEIKDVKEEIKRIEELEDRVRHSNILEWKNDSIYYPIVSELSLPEELAGYILDAEDVGDKIKIETYKNFWTLMSLNTDEYCRKNLFAFLMRHDFKVAKCGFFVAYRNVDTTNIPEVFTDHHTHTFKIKVGEMVTLPRSQCDCDSRQECSRGLHVSSTNWLTRNYYGNVGLVVLVNPADVVAVPERSDYGKLRTCAYLPIDKIVYNTQGKIIPYPKETGFECDLVPKVIYDGVMGTETDGYRFEIPTIPGVGKERIKDSLLEIAKNCIIDRNILYDSKQENS